MGGKRTRQKIARQLREARPPTKATAYPTGAAIHCEAGCQLGVSLSNVTVVDMPAAISTEGSTPFITTQNSQLLGQYFGIIEHRRGDIAMKITQNGGNIAGQAAGISAAHGSGMEIVQNSGTISGTRAIEERDDPAIAIIAARLPSASPDAIQEAIAAIRALRDRPIAEQEAAVRNGRLGKWVEAAKDAAPEILGFLIKTALAAL
jgi:hypothetical protein